ncbi:hypothetical protein HPB50_010786 [Hyalomma asiaticum]|uniref:Uncharacterized protein n=1 Tax=Hyalomma asiaticum TaxID=266040 RepID=A0ACB7RK85_HYAAI|nr:hypothetical protein HPB50_010786 [Hyalomma asiaticum]
MMKAAKPVGVLSSSIGTSGQVRVENTSIACHTATFPATASESLLASGTRQGSRVNYLGICIAQFGSVFWTGHEHPSLVTTALYSATHRGLFSVGIAWVIYACLTDRAGLLTSFLSWPGWAPLSRLSFSTYMIQDMVLQYQWTSLTSRVDGGYYFIGSTRTTGDADARSVSAWSGPALAGSADAALGRAERFGPCERQPFAPATANHTEAAQHRGYSSARYSKGERQQREKLKKSQQKRAATGNRSRTIENPKYAKNDAAHLSEPELSYRCEVCYKLFAKKLELEWHMPEHTGVRPLPCGLCPMKFLTGRVLAAHHTRHHGVGSKWSRFNGGSSLNDSLKRTG